MVTTKVTWQYSIATQEQKDKNLAYEQARANPELDTIVRPSLHYELKEKCAELIGDAVTTATLEIEKDEVAELVFHHHTRTWPDLDAAEQWVAFVLSKGAISAVVVEG